ncbi:probable LRR receptor-like serine/threonine-protein kinase At2g28960 isoform X2 [Durio zibethinus]|uniref:non-specific serine/threonine protein kinase n=1 Tax=Durio zibethinus TaxID=66656 RepID=A0A6P5X7M9_DURZI|nr:probable LRR receptor-like serine/threonine-protein kinase At2g28960 isoform X2 [Durio zibethinus]
MDKVLLMVVLQNMLLLFVFAIISFGDLILAAGGINNEDVDRRKLATENPGFISIDCGVEDDYFDDATGIFFKSDKDFISSGENHETLLEFYFNNNQFGKRYKTLRSFPQGRKNCYTLKLEQAKNNSYRIRASFSYGNFDGKNQAPKFDLYIGVNYWTTVEFNFTSRFYEVIHVFPADTEYVCLVNTGSGTPLISSLEIRPSNYSTSGTGSSALINMGIYDLGSDAGQQVGVRNLSSSNLTGEISPSLADLQAIESIDLSYNELTGSVPEVLARLPNLKVLDLSGNKLKGSIPQSLKDKSDNGSLLLSFSENKKSCRKDSCEENNKKFIVPLVACILSVLALVILLSILVIFHRIKRRKQAEVVNTNASNKEGLLKSKNRPFTYSEIARVTDNFKNEIGVGGFGKVFLGHLNDDTPVAVKLLSSSSKQGYKEFQAEAQLLMIVHHKNLVSLIGYCKDDDNMALVYEFMSNGNLRRHLSETNKTVLNWKQRLQIATDAAQGLDYLHNGCKPPIVHRDLKTSNILLTESLQAKIGDFGLSRVFSTDNASYTSTCPAGTVGYLDPEFHASGNLNKKSDVYSFGVILFELITGLPAIIRISAEDSINLLQWVSPIIQTGDIRNIVDPRLQNDFNVNTAWKAVEIAMSCVLPTSMQRPHMSHVFAELKECLALEIAFGRNDQRVQNEMTRSSNSMEMTPLEMESDMFPIAR